MASALMHHGSHIFESLSSFVCDFHLHTRISSDNPIQRKRRHHQEDGRMPEIVEGAPLIIEEEGGGNFNCQPNSICFRDQRMFGSGKYVFPPVAPNSFLLTIEERDFLQESVSNIHSVDISKSGKHVAIGVYRGGGEGCCIYSVKDTKKPVMILCKGQCVFTVKFSPNEMLLAVGCRDKVYLIILDQGNASKASTSMVTAML